MFNISLKNLVNVWESAELTRKTSWQYLTSLHRFVKSFISLLGQIRSVVVVLVGLSRDLINGAGRLRARDKENNSNERR